jgi:hypothetical protein
VGWPGTVENKNSPARGRTLDFSNDSLQETLLSMPPSIQMILFWMQNASFAICLISPENYFVRHDGFEVSDETPFSRFYFRP